MATFFATQGALNESAARQNPVSQIKTAKQIEYAVDGDVI